VRGHGKGQVALGTPNARLLCLGGVALLMATSGGAQTRVLDDFASVAGWKTAPSQGVTLAVSSDAALSRSNRSMRLDFDFHGRGGWAAIQKPGDLELAENYEFTFRIRGEAPSETLAFKLVDRSGENVWWSVRRDFDFPREWQTIRIKKRQISFAWGPAGGGDLRRAAAIEIAITAGSGGRGSVWISDLALTELPPEHPYAGTPIVTASSSLPNRSPEQAITGAGGGWHSDPKAASPQWLTVDFGERREFGGLVIAWERPPRFLDLQTSQDGVSWTSAWQGSALEGDRSYVPLPETDARSVRVLLKGVPHAGVGIRKLDVKPLGFAATPNDFISSVASDAPRGLYPRGFLGEMTSWTLVGSDDSRHAVGLLGADGAFEPAPRSFAIEPFVWLDGRLITWADVTADQSLLEGYLPIPTVRWTHRSFTLEITAFAFDGLNHALLRYRLTNRTHDPIAPRLVLAVRPFQVNPPSQFLNTPGGVGRAARIAREGNVVAVDGLRIVPLTEPWSIGATNLDAGDITSFLVKGELPHSKAADDRGGRASAAIGCDARLPPGASRDVWLVAGPEPVPPLPATSDVARWAAGKLDLVAASWRDRLDRVEIRLPASAQEFVRATQANLAYVLASREGPALRPGTRSYARSWIRDGAMMAAALLRLGHDGAVRDYLLWYAPFQFPNGKVPCCVDQRGADPVPENDSHGELLFLVAEYLRFTGDKVTAATVWPQVASAVSYLDQLRQQRRSEAYRSPDKLPFFGLLPESISHEGYSAKPMHSYWDDFWALKGLDDAVWLAETLGHPEVATAWTGMRDEFKQDLLTSIARVREEKGLAYLPGCAELGDFDATSTTVALWPAGADAELPREALEATFERYWNEAEARFTGKASWEAYTPYEWRSVGAFVRLGWRDRAVKLANWLMADRMPIGWNQWPEVVHRDKTKAAFLGDLPHAWVGSDFIRSFLDMLAYERGRDGALVLAAGVPHEWLAGSGLTVRALRTPHGALSYTVREEGGAFHVRLEPGLAVPPGGIVVAVPMVGPIGTVTVDGRQMRLPADGEVVVRQCPAEVVILPQSTPPSGGRVPEDKGNQ